MEDQKLENLLNLALGATEEEREKSRELVRKVYNKKKRWLKDPKGPREKRNYDWCWCLFALMLSSLTPPPGSE